MKDKAPFAPPPDDWSRQEALPGTLDPSINGHSAETAPIAGHTAPLWERAWELVRKVPHPILWLALAVGLYVRLSFILADSFPLNDGGMFYIMARDIQQAGFALPWFSSYNALDIPFAYPPLGLYIAAVVDAATPLDLLTVTRFMPLVFNLFTIVAVYFLARAMLPSTTAAGVAAFFFALLPRSFAWLIVGGGLTRSPALFFSVLGILGVYLFYTQREWRYLIPATFFGGLAVLTHPEVGWFTAFTYAIFLLIHGLHRRGIIGSAAMLVGVVVMSAPWWGTVLARHGADPLMAAAGTGGHHMIDAMLQSLWQLNFTEEPYGRLMAALGIVGVFASLARGNITLPLWFVLIFILEPRSAATYAMIPMAMMISLLLVHVVVPGLRWEGWARGRPLAFAGGSLQRLDLLRTTILRPPMLAMAALFLFLSTYATVSAMNSNLHVLRPLQQGDRAAMQWVAENTPEDSKFLVMVYTHWPNDQAGEWFPALTGRRSLATVQGTEWLSGNAFEYRQNRFYQLVGCAYQDVNCVRAWQEAELEHYDYVYLSQACCGAALINTLQESPDHVLVYGTREVGIWQYVPQSEQAQDTIERLEDESDQGSAVRVDKASETKQDWGVDGSS